MKHPILGLHHVTATVDEAQDDLDLCVKALGLRLVKKTVNFDNHHVYHFYYGNEHGTPGTIWTTFPYKAAAFPSARKALGRCGHVFFGARGIAGVLEESLVSARRRDR
jgi:glyoxalase family protein